ncbi:MAG: hypothetical protein P8179_04205 [Candidatus Thiodiazotropha sp.]
MAGISGSSETRLQVDSSRYENSDNYLEQWTALYYRDLASDLRMGTQFELDANEEGVTGRLYQLYLKSGDHSDRPELTIGRFETIDNSGFQTLDGFSVINRSSPVAWKVYAGKPRRFEDLYSSDAETMVGLGGVYDLQPAIKSEQFEKLLFNIGLDHRWSSSKQTNFHGSISGLLQQVEERTQLSDFYLAADVNLDTRTYQRVVIDTHFNLARQGSVRIGYRYYQPDEEPETFRDMYHGFYSMQRQSLWKGVWQLPKWKDLQTYLEMNRSHLEFGSNGAGVAAEMVYAMRKGNIVDLRLDYVELEEEYATSLYLRSRQPISSTLKFVAESVFQSKHTQLSGDNHLIGLSLSVAKMLMKQTTLDLSGEWLGHSDRDNEYRLSVSFRYDFYQTNTGELP